MRPILFASISVLLAAPIAAAQDCEIPPAYGNQVVVEEGGLRIRYATDGKSYGAADDVLLYLVVENVGATTFSINWGIDPQDGHFILKPGFETFEECCSEDFDANVLIYLPSLVHFFSPGTTLDPGECRAWLRTIPLAWVTEGGAPPPAPGRYAVLGGMFRMAADFSPQNSEFIAPRDGAKLYIEITGPTPTAVTTWGAIKALYR